jgi:hypothetical protein
MLFQAQFPVYTDYYFNSLINKIKYRLDVSVRKHYIINLDSDNSFRDILNYFMLSAWILPSGRRYDFWKKQKNKCQINMSKANLNNSIIGIFMKTYCLSGDPVTMLQEVWHPLDSFTSAMKARYYHTRDSD